MNSLKRRLQRLIPAIFMLGILASCNDTKEGTGITLSIPTTGEEVVLSGADAGMTFTIKSNIAAPNNRLIKLAAVSSTPDLCYFTTDEVTLPMGANEVQGKIIFKSKAIEALGSEATISVNIESEGANVVPSSLTYNVKYTPKEKPAEEDITVSVKSKATDAVKISGADVPVEIVVSIDKKSTKDIIIDVLTSRALTSRYTLSDDQLTIKAGETTATTSIIFHNTDFIYTSSRADVKVEIACKTAKVSPSASSVTVSATGTTPITIPSTTMSDNNNQEIAINLNSNDKKARLPIWNIKETAEDMVFLFEVIGAEYGTECKNNFNMPNPVVCIPKYTGTGGLPFTDFYVEFLASAFAAGTHKVTIKATIVSGPARFGGNDARDVSITNVTITK